MDNADNNINENNQKSELLKLELEKCLDQRRFEIDNFWKRGWFFGALILAVGTAYFQANNGDSSYHIYIAFLGFWLSLFQGLMNRGSKYWQERWEAKTKRRESLLHIDVTKTKQFLEKEKYFLDAGILAKGETILNRGARYSVSKLTFLIWDLITLSWAMLWVSNWPLPSDSQLLKFGKEHGVILVHSVFILYILLFFFQGKVYEPLMKKIAPDTGRYAKSSYEHSELYIKGDKHLDALVSQQLAKHSAKPPTRWQKFLKWIR